MLDSMQPEMHSQPRWREWDDFLSRTPGTGFRQTSWWADHRNALGHGTFGAILRTVGCVVGGAMVERRVLPWGSAFYLVSDGPAIPPGATDAGDTFEAILAMIDERRRTEPVTVSHLRIQPCWLSLPAFVHGFAAPPAPDGLTEQQDGATVDVRPDENRILDRMDPAARAGVVNRRGSGVVIVEDASPHGVADFVSLLGPHALESEFGAASPESVAHLAPFLASLRRGSLWFASLFGERVAAALAVTHGNRMVVYHAGRVAPTPHADATRILHFELMRRAKASGCSTYEIRPAVPESGAEALWPGFTAMRRSLGAVRVEHVPTLDLVYNQLAYMQHMAAAAGESVVTGRP